MIFSLNNLLNGGKLSISFKKDSTTGDINFSVNSESTGLKGHEEEHSKLDLKEKTELIQLVNELDIKSPEIISSILNGNKITPEMISEAQAGQISSSESEDSVQ